MMDKRPMTVAEAAEYLQVSEETLNKHRISGTGPKYYKLPNGMIRYYIEDLEAYVRGGDK